MIKIITNKNNKLNKSFEKILSYFTKDYTIDYIDNNISALYEFNDTHTDLLPLVIIRDNIEAYYYNKTSIKPLVERLKQLYKAK